MKKLLSFLTALSLLFALTARAAAEQLVFLPEDDSEDVPAAVFEDDGFVPANAAELVISAPSAILIEKET